MKRVIAKIAQELGVKRDEAELIAATLLERPRFEFYLNHKLCPENELRLWLKLILLKNGVPIEYVTKRIQFREYNLVIYPGVFIPRLETEYFIELINQRVELKPQRILEIGTGCGAIAIALARIYKHAEIVATDISNRALDNARINIERFGLKTRVELIHSDLFENIDTRFDLIVSNPPYVPSNRLFSLPKSVRDFEPLRAINGGKDGTVFIQSLVEQGMSYLNSNGTIALEIDELSVNPLKTFFRKRKQTVSFVQDQFGRYRYLFTKKG